MPSVHSSRRPRHPGTAPAARILTASALSGKVRRSREIAVLNDFVNWYLGALDSGGYALVALLMALESSLVPLPSELVIPPAAHLAATTGHMSIVGIVIAGTAGSWAGAAVMYWTARLLGRPLILHFGRYVFMTSDKIMRAERWSARFGPFGVFASRLLPVIRHLIGIPAGIVRLPFARYSLATLAGSAIWSGVLSWVGVVAGADKALLAGDMRHVTVWLAGFVVALGLLYYLFVHRHMRSPSTGG
jgi:membrane protein DedA with SNARE-associated domain